MAHHSATKKAIRQTATRTTRNRHVRSTYRSAIKNVISAVINGDKENAPVLLRTAQKQLMKAVTKGVIRKDTASRRVSRLNAAVKKLVTA